MQKLLSSRLEVHSGRYVAVLSYYDAETDSTGQITIDREAAREILGWLCDANSIENITETEPELEHV